MSSAILLARTGSYLPPALNHDLQQASIIFWDEDLDKIYGYRSTKYGLVSLNDNVLKHERLTTCENLRIQWDYRGCPWFGKNYRARTAEESSMHIIGSYSYPDDAITTQHSHEIKLRWSEIESILHEKVCDIMTWCRTKAASVGRFLCAQMRDLLDRQMYEIIIQAAANGKIVARETLKAYRKNVLAKCYGKFGYLSPLLILIGQHAKSPNIFSDMSIIILICSALKNMTHAILAMKWHITWEGTRAQKIKEWLHLNTLHVQQFCRV